MLLFISEYHTIEFGLLKAVICLRRTFAARFNLACFSGTYRQDDASWMADPACVLWQKQQDSGFWQYMQLVMNESAGDNLHWKE